MSEFTHLHVHTQYSILDGAASIEGLLKQAGEYGMDSLAITDHGNLFGGIKFYNTAKAHGIKPLIGCEIYLARRGRFNKTTAEDRSGYHLVLIARDEQGYHNLSKLSTLGFKRDAFYYTPRIDKELLRKYSGGLIASSACLGGEIPSLLLHNGMEKAELALEEYLDIFGDDFYLELMDHGLEEQKTVNRQLVQMAHKYDLKLIASNDVHFIRAEDYEAHHILICLNTGKDVDDKSGMHYSGQEYLKSPEEMKALFKDYPEAISNTQEIVEKVENYSLTTSKIVLPHFPLPEKFDDENEYLRHLTYKGAEKLYPEMNEEVKERLERELGIIKDMGFPGYFLIVQDFINAAREMDVTVGPGRGSAAGSAVAYCIGVTNIDPIHYNLFFERFLNPERVSMPDIDVDFDDEGRKRVMDYVVDKYGEEKVAQIITFGTMAARLSIRDVARVLKLPLDRADYIAKLVPEKAGISLEDAYKEVPELQDLLDNGEPLERKTLEFARILEGSARNTGTHACGVIIGPDDLMEHIPLSTAKDSDLMVTQYEGKLIESAGMLKMDFLGLKTLSIIKDALENIFKSCGEKIDIENIPLDDKKTYELYKHGDTIGTFQFESAGMQKYLRELKPTYIEDLIAMNALYRPGPMQFIPTYINRKHGKEKVNYPHPWLEKILKPTNGIMVYQEQIMQTAQILAGFSLGKADQLRRAMGKKNMEVMQKMEAEFVEGAAEKDIDEKKAKEIFAIMQEFAKYGFNRSHSAAYTIIAYQTAYLKAHYPAEYMAAVLTHNLSDIKKITFFIDECRRMKIPVLGPHVNESELFFTVNKRAEIRFGMAAIKGVGESAVKEIIRERNENGLFEDVFDLCKRINLRTVNRKSLESLAKAGAFDEFENSHRAQYFYRESEDDSIFLEKIIRHGSDYQARQAAAQVSLFGDAEDSEMRKLELPECPAWTKIDKLKTEKSVAGFFMSGHPLDDYKPEIEYFCNVELNDLKQDLKKLMNEKNTLVFAAILTNFKERTTKNGKLFGNFTLEDFNSSIQLAMFGEAYLKNRHLLVEGFPLLVKARVRKRYKSEDQLEINVEEVEILADVFEKHLHTVCLKMKLESLSTEFNTMLVDLLNENEGKTRLNIEILDEEEGIIVSMPSGKMKINASDLIRQIKNISEIDYRLN